MTEPVGLVGVGAMGSALLKRLVLAGCAVKAYDILDERTAEAAKAGAEAAASPKAAAEGSPCTHVFVRTDDEVKDAVLGADGVLQGAGEGALVLLHSTIMPETTKQVAGEAAGRGVTVIDAPVTAAALKARWATPRSAATSISIAPGVDRVFPATSMS